MENPTRWLSRAVGRLAATPSRPAVSLYARLLGIDPASAEDGPHGSVGAFFIRRLRPEARPVDPSPDALVSPADGRFQGGGHFSDPSPPLIVKGQRLDYRAFLGHPSWASRFAEGSFFSVYLSPRDYHRVHAPFEGDVLERRHLPGALFPVNALGVRLFSDLFVRNERAVVRMRTSSFGEMVVALVGATNVGSIRLSFDPTLATNRRGQVETTRRFEGVHLHKGQELGWFELGSTVVVMTERRLRFRDGRSRPVRQGESLAEPAPPKPSGSVGGAGSGSGGAGRSS